MNKPNKFSSEISKKVARKLKALRNPTNIMGAGLGMMGIIGWSVVVPTLLGVAIGVWLDNKYSVKHSWTLILLSAGLCLGCLNACYWLTKEHKDMQDKEDKNDK